MLVEIVVLLAIIFVWLPVVSISVGLLMRSFDSHEHPEIFLAVAIAYFVFIIIPTWHLWKAAKDIMPGIAGKSLSMVFSLPAIMATAPMIIVSDGFSVVLEPWWGFDFSEVTL